MSWKHWLDDVKGQLGVGRNRTKRGTSRHQALRNARLKVERLEDRTVLSGGQLVTGLSGPGLVDFLWTGTSGADHIVVGPYLNPGSIYVEATLRNGLAVSEWESFEGITGQLYFDALEGNDSIDLSAITTLQASVAGGDGSDTIIGTQHTDILSGGGNDDVIEAGGGNDTVIGGDGADLVSGSAGDDSLLGGTGDDFLFGGAGADTLYGGTGGDIIDGGSDSDRLDGDESTTPYDGAVDILIGGFGSDVLQYGEIADRYAGSEDADGNDSDRLIYPAAYIIDYFDGAVVQPVNMILWVFETSIGVYDPSILAGYHQAIAFMPLHGLGGGWVTGMDQIDIDTNGDGSIDVHRAAGPSVSEFGYFTGDVLRNGQGASDRGWIPHGDDWMGPQTDRGWSFRYANGANPSDFADYPMSWNGSAWVHGSAQIRPDDNQTGSPESYIYSLTVDLEGRYTVSGSIEKQLQGGDGFLVKFWRMRAGGGDPILIPIGGAGTFDGFINFLGISQGTINFAHSGSGAGSSYVGNGDRILLWASPKANNTNDKAILHLLHIRFARDPELGIGDAPVNPHSSPVFSGPSQESVNVVQGQATTFQLAATDANSAANELFYFRVSDTTPLHVRVNPTTGLVEIDVPRGLAPGAYDVLFGVSDAEMDFTGTSAVWKTITVNVLPGTTADAGGPYLTWEGSGVTLDGSGSVPAAGASIVSYEWDVNGDGNYSDATGVAPTLTWAQLVALGINDGYDSRFVRVRVTDSLSDVVVSDETALEIMNLPPTAIISGPAVAVRGETVTLTLNAFDPSSPDLASIQYEIDWNDDGVWDELVAGAPSVNVSRVFTQSGVQGIRARAWNSDGNPFFNPEPPVAYHQVSIVPWMLRQDANNPSYTDLVWGGTNGFDAYLFIFPGLVLIQGENNAYFASPQPVFTGSFNGRVLVYAQGSSDLVFSDVMFASMVIDGGEGDDVLIGGRGADTIRGGGGNDIIFGGTLESDASDWLEGGAGDDLIVGHYGTDTLKGGTGQDLLIAGHLLFDDLPGAVFGIQAEWLSGRPIAERVANLSGTGTGERNNGDIFLLPGSTVLDDSPTPPAVIDQVFGEEDDDWLLFDFSDDIAPDVSVGDVLTNLG